MTAPQVELTPLQLELLAIHDAAPSYRAAVQLVQEYFDEKDSHFSLTHCETLMVKAKTARLMARVNA